MLTCSFMPSSTHKASCFSISLFSESGKDLIQLETVIYKTDRVAGEQVINVFGLRVCSQSPLRGAELSGDMYSLSLSTPEAHEAYQLFLQAADSDLELYMRKKLRETLENAAITNEQSEEQGDA